jgi:hypothetical protein
MLGNKYLAAAVIIILVFVLAYNVKFFTAKNRKAKITPAQRTEIMQHTEVSMITIPERPVEIENNNRWESDPFNLQVLPKKTVVKEKKPELNEGILLMGIIKRDGKSHALINGKVYSVNDRIGNVVIKDISRRGVVLSSGEKIKEISFEDYIILKEKSK